MCDEGDQSKRAERQRDREVAWRENSSFPEGFLPALLSFASLKGPQLPAARPAPLPFRWRAPSMGEGHTGSDKAVRGWGLRPPALHWPGLTEPCHSHVQSFPSLGHISSLISS